MVKLAAKPFSIASDERSMLKLIADYLRSAMKKNVLNLLQ